MTYRTPSRKADALDHAAPYVKYWPAMSKALKARIVALEHDRQASAIAAVGRKGLDEEWLARKAEHDVAESATKAPEDFAPFAEPRPDVGALQDLAAIYRRNRMAAQRDVESEAADYTRFIKLLDSAWRKLPAVKPETMTVAEAAGVEAERDAGRKILRAANLASAKAAGCTEQDRKAMLRAAKVDPDRLPNLDALVAERNRTSDAAVEADRNAKAKAKAERERIKAEARANAEARLGTQAKTKGEVSKGKGAK